MILRAVGNPSPLPAGRVEKNASKMRARTSLVIPTPVSITSRTTQPSSRRVVRMSSPPDGIACSAFKTRFKRACLTRSASIRVSGKSAARNVRIRMPLDCRRRLVKIAELIDDLVQIGRHEPQLLHPGKSEKVFQDVAQSIDLVSQPFDPLKYAAIARGLGLLKVFGEKIEIQRDRRQRVPDLMSKAAGKLRDLGVLGSQARVISGSSSAVGSTGARSPAGDNAPALGGEETVGESAAAPDSAEASGESENVLDWSFAM